MTTESSAEAYFHWLVMQVEIENSHRDYEDLLTLMHGTEFVWLVPNDDNRLMDGLDLRAEFGLNGEAGWCSVLEVMIALSRRMAFQVGGTPEGWAWQFLLNLGFERFHDPLTKRKIEQVNEDLESLVYRTYNPNGQGGFFPLQDPDEDQTRVEIWYQMAAYIAEVLPD